MEPIFYDTETCGLHSMPVLIQYAVGRGDIRLHSIWTTPIDETLELIERMMLHEGGLVGFNNAFDSFHLTKIYNCLMLLKADLGNGEANPIGYINEIANLEPSARDGVALKPVKVLDLMLYARKGPYQSLMDRDDVRIRTVPEVLASKLCDALNDMIKLKDVYFERSKSKQRWRVLESRDKDGTLKIGFKDIVLKFAPSTALKALAVDALDLKEAVRFQEISINKRFMPREMGFAPFALAGVFGKKGTLIRVSEENWRGTWPSVIEHHISHWAFNPLARQYAKNDIEYTRGLYYHFLDNPCDGIKMEFNDDDSVLSFMVGTVRWHGFAVDIEGIKSLRLEASRLLRKTPTAPIQVKKYLQQVMNPLEQLALPNTKAITLESIAKWKNKAGERAQEVISARHAMKEIELYDKLLIAGRFHTSFKVIGALSSRMSGSDGLNPQGIKRTKVVRSKFTLNWDTKNFALCGGDFGGFEMTIMDAAYYDPELHPIIEAKKIHAHWGAKYFFPELGLEGVLASKGKEPDYYVRSKNMVFAMAYFGTEHTLMTRGGLSEERAKEAYENILAGYPLFTEKRNKVIGRFVSMTQPGGIGSPVFWKEPDNYIESYMGFRRYFTLENNICKNLFQLAENPPPEWLELQIKVRRRSDRLQTVGSAVRSALFGAAFGIQAANARAAGNHVIQSSGAQITKHLQAKLWELQPCGCEPFRICPMQVHDEVLTVTARNLMQRCSEIVNETVSELRSRIPLLEIEWKQDIDNWSQKG